MNLSLCIRHLFPDAVEHVDFVTTQYIDGTVEITEWNLVDPEPTQAELDAAHFELTKLRQLKLINNTCDTALAAITAGYPAGELASWDKQEAEARAYLADTNATVPFIATMATARGVDVADLANRIVTKADAFAGYSAGVIGTRQALEDALEAATTVAEVEAVVWPS